LPTYLPAAPGPHPMFLERRVDQGSSGRVYPLPLLAQHQIRTELKLPLSPFQFARTIALEGPIMVLDYALTSHSDTPEIGRA
jgi:hypothetical protein